ncbi:ferredoxin [Patescibacteria group bacterium]|nr:MAG: ferredoxin [Patescibacteria group bacterium]
MNKILKIRVDSNLCIGAAPCISTAPEVFKLDEENKAVMKIKGRDKGVNRAERKELAADAVSDDILTAAAQSCPVKAIFLYDENENQIYP